MYFALSSCSCYYSLHFLCTSLDTAPCSIQHFASRVWLPKASLPSFFRSHWTCAIFFSVVTSACVLSGLLLPNSPRTAVRLFLLSSKLVECAVLYFFSTQRLSRFELASALDFWNSVFDSLVIAVI